MWPKTEGFFLRVDVGPDRHSKTLEVLVDTGSGKTILTPETFEALKPCCPPLSRSNAKMTGYTGEPVVILGQTTVRVRLGEVVRHVQIYVAKDGKEDLCGLQWIAALGPDRVWAAMKAQKVEDPRKRTVCVIIEDSEPNSYGEPEEDEPDHLYDSKEFNTMVGRYPEVFRGDHEDDDDRRRRYKAPLDIGEVDIHLRSEVHPKAWRPRNLPLTLSKTVQEEIEGLVHQGVLKRVAYSDWTSPLVVVRKADGSVRLCGDYKGKVEYWFELKLQLKL